ncbi:MAG: PHP domain-containing protein [Desulfobacterales bacterium]
MKAILRSIPETVSPVIPYRIEFKRPDLDQLSERYTVVDMHFHSAYSDGINGARTIAAKARHLGIGIGITDHNEIRGALEIDRIEGVFSIPGIEVTSAEGSHLLVYFDAVDKLRQFYFDDIQPFMGPDVMCSTRLEMEEIIDRAKPYDALVVFPHPFSAAYTGVCNSYFSEDRLQNLFEAVDGVEVINASNMNKWNLQCAVLGFNIGKVMTGGSDGHRISQMGRAVTCVECPPDRSAFLKALRERQSLVVGKEIDIIRKVTTHTIKLRTNWKNYPDLLEKNIRYSYALFNSKSRNLRDNVRRSLNNRMNRKKSL